MLFIMRIVHTFILIYFLELEEAVGVLLGIILIYQIRNIISLIPICLIILQSHMAEILAVVMEEIMAMMIGLLVMVLLVMLIMVPVVEEELGVEQEDMEQKVLVELAGQVL
jgi:hypothetical protein